MHTDTRRWIFYQLKGLFYITALAMILSFGSNMLRDQPLQLVEKRRLLKAGDDFPFVPLTQGGLLAYQEYLRLPPGKEIVTIADISADLLVIEVLNAFCFPCQTHTLTLNQVYDIIEKTPELKGRIKLIGIAFGNTRAVLKDFIQEYGVPFPVVPDPHLRAEKVIGPEIHTPFSLFIRPDKSGKLGLIVATYDGAIENPQVLVRALIGMLKTPPGEIKPGALFEEGDSTQGQH
jgi:hypothetical protein